MAAQLSLHLPIVGKRVEGDNGVRDTGLLAKSQVRCSNARV